jgi:hypothetical protein
MGGIGFAIEIRRVSPEASPVNAVHYKLWEMIEREIRQTLEDPGNEITTSEYLGDQAYEGLQEGGGGEWSASETELGFAFRDLAGLCSMSMYASLHWSIMAFTWIKPFLDEVDGWTLGDAPPIGPRLVRNSSPPLAYLKRGMFAIVRRERGKPREPEAGFGDDTSLTWTELDDEDLARVEWSALTGLCQCDLCLTYHANWARSTYQPVAHVDAARAAWALLESDGKAELEAQVLDAVRAWPWDDDAGPPELAVLSDWLAERGAELPPDALGAMVMTRGRR